MEGVEGAEDAQGAEGAEGAEGTDLHLAVKPHLAAQQRHVAFELDRAFLPATSFLALRGCGCVHRRRPPGGLDAAKLATVCRHQSYSGIQAAWVLLSRGRAGLSTQLGS